MKHTPLVSVVIPTYNSEKTIGACIDSILKQGYKPIEIVVVDNFSTDRTFQVASALGARGVQINAGRSAARNVGINNSSGEYLLCIDSDMRLSSAVVDECVKKIEEGKKIGGVVIPEESTGNSFWVKVRNFEKRFYENTPVESARFFPMVLVKRAGGYDETLVFFEESTLPQKIEKMGYGINSRVQAKICHDEQNFSLAGWLKKKYMYGKTAKDYKGAYKEYASRQMGPIYRYSLFINDRRFYASPILACGVLILKTLEYLSAFFGSLGRVPGE